MITAITRKKQAIAKQTLYTARYPTTLSQPLSEYLSAILQKCGILSNLSRIPGDNITADMTVPRRRRTVYTILEAVEFLHEGHRAQQHMQADEPQQQAA